MRTICIILLTLSVVGLMFLPVNALSADFEIICPQNGDGVPLKKNLKNGAISSLGSVEEALARLVCDNIKQASLVINEVDYDQPSTDTAEFIELKNVSGLPINLHLFTIEIVNGSNLTIARTIDLPDVFLGPGEYYVICGDANNVANCDLDVTPDTNLIENGAPDAVALMKIGVLVDSVSYEGNAGGYTEASGVGLVDPGNVSDVSISRCPDGIDTDRNNVDFSLQASTPGEENNCP